MILVGRMASPFVRRTAVLLDLLGIEFELRPLSVAAEQERVRTISPVGRVPALQVNGKTYVDSVAIALTLLDEHDPDGELMPKHGRPFAEALQFLFIINGVTEKFVAGYYERTRRPREKVHQEWIDLCEAQAASGLDALERSVGDPVALGDTLTYVGVAITTSLTFIAERSGTVFTGSRHPRLETLRQQCEAHKALAQRPPV